MLTINISLQAETPEQMDRLRLALIKMFSHEGAVAFSNDPGSVTAMAPVAEDGDKLPLKGPVAPKRTRKTKNPDPVEETPQTPEEPADQPDAAPAEEEKPKPKRGRRRKADTPTGEASPAATATTSPEDLRNEAARQLADHFGTKKPGKALKDLLNRYDATTAMDVPDTRASEFLAEVKALVGGAAVETPDAAEKPRAEKKISEKIEEDLGI